MFSLFYPKQKHYIDWAYITSGEGEDYHIVKKSPGVPRELEIDIVSLSLIPAYVSPSKILRNGVRAFILRKNLVGLSFVEYAGRDELNRPAKMASRTFIIPNSLYNLVTDPDFYRNHLDMIENSNGSIKVETQNVVDYLKSYYSSLTTRYLKDILTYLDESKLATIFSCFISGRKVALYGGEEIEIYDASTERLSSYSIIRVLLYLTPKPIRVKLGYSTISSSLRIDKANIFFLDKSPEYESPLKEKKITLIDLVSGKIWNNYKNRLGRKYAKLVYQNIETDNISNVILISDMLLDGYIGLVSAYKNMRSGYRIIETLLEIAERGLGVW